MEVISIIISALAILVSIVSLIKSDIASKTANDLNQRSNDFTQGQVEMQIRNMITSAKAQLSVMNNQLSQNKENEVLKASFSDACEEVANAYDEACMKYLDGKVDKERFKKAYINEIKNIVENDVFKDKYVMPQSKFHATVKVYNEWHNLEK